nr:MAG TPA: hypothetical protein [Caudoviricetes sp.]
MARCRSDKSRKAAGLEQIAMRLRVLKISTPARRRV